ncbi:MAG: hypothetical protein ABJE10_22835 [bacterium]
MRSLLFVVLTASLCGPLAVYADTPSRVSDGGPVVSAPIRDVRYTVTFDSALAQRRIMHVAMSFDVMSRAPVILSLPAWSPGHYKLVNFAKNVMRFTATNETARLRVHKRDFDTWSIDGASNARTTVEFDYLADSLEDGNGISWTAPNFGFFSGTNLLLYPEGRSADFPATLTVVTSPGWRVVTSLHLGDAPHTFREASYHDLVDNPVFIGRFDVDSVRAAGRWTRFASYPAGALTGAPRDSLERRIERVIPIEAQIFGETPWDSYTAFMVFDSATSGYGALEHQSSFLGRFGTNLAQSTDPTIVYLAAHEIFHAWNVKRLRPSEMVPYRYDAPQPTPWLWVSEGVTDYYADIAMVRAHVIDSLGFIAQVAGKIGYVATTPSSSLEDNSLSAWISPRDGSDQVYYPKGYLAALMLDVLIRDASDNRSSLDDVMRSLYASTYKNGRGFTDKDWWDAVSKAASGRPFSDFAMRYVSGREEYPWATVLPLMGLRYSTDTVRVARFGAGVSSDSVGQRVTSVVAGGTADGAHVQVGDYLVSVAGIAVRDANWTTTFRAQFNGRKGAPIDVVVRRGGVDVTLAGTLKTVDQVDRVQIDSNASPKAARIRHAMLASP